IALARKGSGGIALTTDQVAAAAMPPGRYQLGGREVISDGQTVRRQEGMFAGSLATMPQLIRIAAGLPGSNLQTAVTMASLTPARALRLPWAGLLGARRLTSSSSAVICRSMPPWWPADRVQ